MTVLRFTVNRCGVAISPKSQSALVTYSLKDGVLVLPPTETKEGRVSNPPVAPALRADRRPLGSEPSIQSRYTTPVNGRGDVIRTRVGVSSTGVKVRHPQPLGDSPILIWSE